MAGEAVEVKVAFYGWVTEQINAKSNLSSITKAEIQTITVTNADGKESLSGCVRAADQKNACPKISP